MMKSKIRFLHPQKDQSTPFDKIRQQFLQAIHSRDFWWALFFLVTLLLLFSFRIEAPVPNYKLGDIAHMTVRAPHDIQVPDIPTTDKIRKEAQERVLPVYDYEPGLVHSSVSRIHEVFEYLRNHHVPVNPEKDWQEVSREINNLLKLHVDSRFLATAASKSFEEEFERFLTQKLRKAMSEYIVTDRNVLYMYASKGLNVRLRESGHEEKLEVTSVPDTRDVRETIATELEGDTRMNPQEAAASADFLNSFIVPTIYFNSTETDARVAKAARITEPVFYQIKKGKVIVRDGEEVSAAVLPQLNALKQARQAGPPIRFSIGVLILLLIYLIAFHKYLDVHQFSQIKLRGKALFQMCGMVLLVNTILVKLGFLIATSVSGVFSSSPLNLLLAYQVAIPFATGALLLTILTDREIPTIYSLAFAILTGVISKGDFFLAFYCLASGIAAAFSIRRYYQRSALLRSCFLIWLANLLTVFTIHLLREMPLSWNEMFFYAICTFVSAMLSAAITSVISPLFEWWFNITTDIKLLELSNLDLPVLRQLALEAPGTYHHSIVMGTIAEAAAERVGANPLFLRVAALYHDIGKTRKSEYYVENQREHNKHDTLNPRMSALVIMNHVKEGMEVARMLRLPSDIADMIPQHHGTRLITYFYKKAKDMENPEIEQVKEEDYRYPGPKPQTKEGAILMLADATEAASRTLTEPTPARIRNMVNTLFRAVFEDGQLDESNLTMKDLTIIADAFVRKLESVFHHRISYPGYEFNKDEKAKDSSDYQKLSEKMVN